MFMRWRRVRATVVPFLLDRQVLNAWTLYMFASREMLAAFSAEDCKHREGDAPAYFAEQRGARV